MADVVPAAQTGAVVSASGGSAPVAVTVTDGGGAALKLSEGALLDAVANTRAIKGGVEVTTADGTTFLLKAQPGMTLPAFPPGAKLTLQGTASGQLYLVAVNGRPLAGVTVATMNAAAPPGGMAPVPPTGTGPGATAPATTSPGPAAPGQSTPAGPAGPQPPPASAPPSGLTAVVIRPAQPAATMPPPGAQAAAPTTITPPPAQPGTGLPPGLPADLPAGARLTVRIAGVELPPAGLPAGTPPPSSPAAAGPAATLARAAVLAPQVVVPPTTTANPAAILLPANVLAHPPGGNAVVQTAIGTLAVPTYSDLPTGTQLLLEVVGKPLPPLPTAVTTPPSPQPGLTSQGWPALSQALDVLATANQPQALEQLLRAVPQADTRLAAAMATFTGALRGSDGKGAVPESSLRGLEKAGRKDLTARLVGDLESLREEAGRPVGNGEWRAYTMPFLSGGVVEPVRLFVRRPPDGEGAAAGGGRGDKNNDHRFVVDLNLSRMGRLQLDGLVRREERLFDLIIRTGAPLDTEIRRDILGIFTNASELVGTKGTVSFQAGGRWLDFPPAPPAPTRIEV